MEFLTAHAVMFTMTLSYSLPTITAILRTFATKKAKILVFTHTRRFAKDSNDVKL